MKIVWLCSWYPNPDDPFDGDFVQRHAKSLAKLNPVTVFYVSQSGLHKQEYKYAKEKNSGVSEIIISFRFKSTGIPVLNKFIYNWKYYRTYRKAIRDYFQREGMPDLIHVHVPMKAGMIARWIKKKWDIPFVVTEHSAHYSMGTNDDFFKKGIVHRKNVARIFKEAEVVTNVSSFFAERLKKFFSLNKVRVINNAVDTDLFCYRPSTAIPFKFVHVSTLSEHQKNVRGILNATQKLLQKRADFELVIVGPTGEGLKHLMSRFSLSNNVSFTNEIPYAQVADQMKQASALVLFSRYENSPCVIIEALCCGLPVISSDVGGIKEIVNGSNGLLVESEDEDKLAFAMNDMIDNYDRYKREEIAIAARKKFSYETIGKNFLDLYEEVLKK
jgi:glycosyltransferase involved in cell wall biosynthesis